jgi:hypothetical protein
MTMQELYNNVADLINYEGNSDDVCSLIKEQMNKHSCSITPTDYVEFVFSKLVEKCKLDVNGQCNKIFDNGLIFARLYELKSFFKLTETDITDKYCRLNILMGCRLSLQGHKLLLQDYESADKGATNKLIFIRCECSYIIPLYKCITDYYVANSSQSDRQEFELIKAIGDIAKELATVSCDIDVTLSINYRAIYNDYKLSCECCNISANDANIEQEKQSSIANTDIYLPRELDSDRARKYFARAIEVGYMEQATATSYKWLYGNGNNASLGYFVERVFCPTNTEKLREQAINKLFGVRNIRQTLNQVHNAKQPQKWQALIDKEIFYD